jgi:hypothetical protein
MNKNFFAGLFVGLGLLVVFAFRPTGEKPVVQKWEYKSIYPTLGEKKLQEAFDLAGQEGWEYAGFGSFHWFKRPIQ